MLLSTFGLLGSLICITSAVSVDGKLRRDEKPALPYDPNTTKYCSWWFDNDGSITCSAMPASWSISLSDFLRWNPSITAQCTNFVTGKSYCVEAFNEPPPTTTTSSTATPTPTGNGITTPSPIQSGMVTNCNRFHFVAEGEGCAAIASAAGISLSQFYAWNPAAGSGCSGLWSNTYACTGIIGFLTSVTTTSKATTTSAGNGIATPTPTQAGMVSNCNKFYYVKSGDECGKIASANGITLAQFNAWNPGAGSTCSTLWLDTYYCVGIVGFTPTTSKTTSKPATTTSAGNGVATPTPYQTGMTTKCKTFHYVKTGEDCSTISKAAGISIAQFYSWNPAAGSTCTGLWADTYCCIAVL